MERTDAVTKIKGVGEKTAAYFHRAGIDTVGDLLQYYPRGYETFEAPVSVRQARFRDAASVHGFLTDAPVTRYVKRMQLTEAVIRDEEGSTLRLTWFNMPYLSKSLKPGASYVFRGAFSGGPAYRKMQQPKIYRPEDYETLRKTLQPVYPLTHGLTKKMLQDAVKAVFSEGVYPEETLSPELRSDYGLIGIEEAVRQIHFPESREALVPARKRLVFEEFYRFILDVHRMKETVSAAPNRFLIREKAETEELIRALPYRLTGAQERTLS